MHCASIVLALLAALRAGGYEFSHIFSRFASTSNDSNASTIIVLFTQSISYRVRSFLEYSATVWHPRQKYNSDKLEMVQRRAARFVKGRHEMFESVTQMLEQLTWIPLSKKTRKLQEVTIKQDKTLRFVTADSSSQTDPCGICTHPS